MSSFLYFGYASNMFTKRMHINCPSAKKICIAKLKDFKLAFADYAKSWKGATATILESPGDFVWGVVWDISKEEEDKLDRQESSYKSIKITVETEDSTELTCKSFQKLSVTDSCSEPSLVYKSVIILGAKEHEIPIDYIKHIETFKDNGYKGNVDIPVNIEL